VGAIRGLYSQTLKPKVREQALPRMEPMRPVVDRKVLQFALSHTFTPGDFAISGKGGCRLNPQMARVVAREIGKIEANAAASFISLLRR
jgi:CRISPR/Cas system-associated endonuclease Cas1